MMNVDGAGAAKRRRLSWLQPFITVVMGSE